VPGGPLSAWGATECQPSPFVAYMPACLAHPRCRPGLAASCRGDVEDEQPNPCPTPSASVRTAIVPSNAEASYAGPNPNPLDLARITLDCD